MQKSKILKHFESIPDSDNKEQFKEDVNACVGWDGSFSSRRKRSIEEELGQVGGKYSRVLIKIYIHFQENLGSLSLVTLSRTKRQAVGKKTMKKTAAKKTAIKGGAKGARKMPVKSGQRSAKGGPAAGRMGGKAKGKAVKAKAKGKKTAKSGRGAKGGKLAGGRQTAKNPKYNALWCVDLAVQKYLRTCVENILG